MTMSNIDNKRVNYNIIGMLCKHPELFRDERYRVAPEEFPLKVQEIMVAAMYELSYNNVDLKKITPTDVDNYLAAYPLYYSIFEKNTGFNYLEHAIESCNEELFDQYYKEFKKLSLLRLYEKSGFDVKKIYNYDETCLATKGEQYKKVMSMSEQDIVNAITTEVLMVRDTWEYTNKGEVTNFMAGTDLRENMRNLLNNEGKIGLALGSEHLSSIFLGANRGELLLRSASTGSGKSRGYISDCVRFACRQMWSDGKWIDIGQNIPTLYVGAELELEEIQLMMVACVSGVGTRRIKEGNMNPVEVARVNKAIDIIEEAPIYIEILSDFDTSDIQMLVEKYVIKHNIGCFFLDYMELTPKLARNTSELFGGIASREDMCLGYFADILKRLAVKYNIFIESGTQCSRDMSYTASSLAGGRATAKKVDMGVIQGYIDQDEFAKIQGLCEATGKTPNFVYRIYKNRGGGESFIKIYVNMDLGNMRENFCFATDYQGNLKDFTILDIKPIQNSNPYDNVDF